MANLSLSFFDASKELEEVLGEKINIYNMHTRGSKSITVITGLKLSKNEEKEFLSKGKEKFSTAGYKKIVPEFDQKNDSYCFPGDNRLGSKELIMKLFDKSNDCFNIH